MKNLNKNQLFYTTLDFVKRDIRVRYAGSLLGSVWIILYPMSLAAVSSIIFSFIFRGEIGGVSYFLYVFSGFVIWTYFARTISQGVRSINANRQLVLNSRFPRESIVISVIISQLIDLGINLIVLFGFYVIMGGKIGIEKTTLLIVIILLQTFFQAGVVFVLSSINVYFRDVQNIADILLQLLFYMTPVIYPIEIVPVFLRSVVSMNPLTSIVSNYRSALFLGIIEMRSLLILVLISLTSFVFGIYFFNKLEKRMAETV